MDVKQIKLSKSLALNRDQRLNLLTSQGFVTNGEWLIKEDYINVNKFSLDESRFWESLYKKLTKHDRKTVVDVKFDNVEYGYVTPKGLDAVKIELKDSHKKTFNCYIQQVYYEKFIVPLTKNKGVTVETCCPEYPTKPDAFDPFPYSNKLIFKHNNEYIGVLMPLEVLDDNIRYKN